AVTILEGAVDEGGAELAEPPVREREGAARHRTGPTAGEAGGRAHRPPHARGVLLQQRVHARQREGFELQVRVGPAARGKVALQGELARPVHALECQPTYARRRIGDGELGRPLQYPDVAGELHGERVQPHGPYRAGGARPAGEASAGEKGTARAHARAGEPGERVQGPAPGRRRPREPERAVGEG